ncbi:MAG: 30S ribosomal protein S6 [Lachnospiraceae bacterium]|nr:30S ribosomal protein S6 [Lachnospiraceae bacterium]
MNKYELALVVSAKLDSETIAATVQRAKDYIERFGGMIGEVEEWGKRKLAYEIQKQTEAYYFFINFEAEAQVPAQLESVLRIMDNVLRYLVLAKDENDTFKVAPEKAPAAEEAPEAPAAEEEVPAEEEPAAEEEAAE